MPLDSTAEGAKCRWTAQLRVLLPLDSTAKGAAAMGICWDCKVLVLFKMPGGTHARADSSSGGSRRCSLTMS